METKDKIKLEIKAVIFDMDGLLIDSEPLWREATIKIFNEIGISLTEDQCKETMGFRVNEFVEYWIIKYKLEGIDEKDVSNRIVKEIISLIKLKGKIMEGVNELIDLFNKEGIVIVIASSSFLDVIEAVVEKISIKDKIKLIYSAENEVYGKPHPGVYITAAKSLGVLPIECLAFEDSPNGVLSTKAAKIRCVAVPNGVAINDKRFGIADLIIPSLKDFTLESLSQLE